MTDFAKQKIEAFRENSSKEWIWDDGEHKLPFQGMWFYEFVESFLLQAMTEAEQLGFAKKATKTSQHMYDEMLKELPKSYQKGRSDAVREIREKIKNSNKISAYCKDELLASLSESPEEKKECEDWCFHKKPIAKNIGIHCKVCGCSKPLQKPKCWCWCCNNHEKCQGGKSEGGSFNCEWCSSCQKVQEQEESNLKERVG